MEGFMIIFFLYIFFLGLIGAVLGMAGVLNENSLLTPKDIIKSIKEMDKIQIYHILCIFGIAALIIYYIFFVITTILLKIGSFTIYKRQR